MQVPPHARIRGAAREQLIAHLRERYQQGATIKELSIEIGRSAYNVHRLLREGGVEMRARSEAPSRLQSRAGNGLDHQALAELDLFLRR